MEQVAGHIPLAGLEPETLEKLLSERGIEHRYSYRLLYWIYKKGIESFSQVNDIPKSVLTRISEYFETGLFRPESSSKSADGTIKYLFRNKAGLLYETVYLPEEKRNTVCVSSQSGCRMGCRFCATGLNGWSGDLTAGEIINQVISLPVKASHIVMMGMGEPGDNIGEVIKALRIFTSEWGLAKGRSRITVSTVGILPSLERLLNETDCNLTLSLHSPFPEERRRFIPCESRWPVKDAIEMIKNFRALKGRRFTAAYVMVKGINDTDVHLEGLKMLLSGSKIRVNLLPYHPYTNDSYSSSDPERMMMFKHILVTSGIEASVRRSRGSDIEAACGMLAAKKK